MKAVVITEAPLAFEALLEVVHSAKLELGP
jgi:hypothetical protein